MFGIHLNGLHEKGQNFPNQLKYKITKGLFRKRNLLVNDDLFIILLKVAFHFGLSSPVKGSNAV